MAAPLTAGVGAGGMGHIQFFARGGTHTILREGWRTYNSSPLPLSHARTHTEPVQAARAITWGQEHAIFGGRRAHVPYSHRAVLRTRNEERPHGLQCHNLAIVTGLQSSSRPNIFRERRVARQLHLDDFAYNQHHYFHHSSCMHRNRFNPFQVLVRYMTVHSVSM